MRQKVWLIRELNDISNIHSKFQDHTINKFSKWRLLIFPGGNHQPYPPSLTVYLNHPGYPHFFFHKKYHKGCTLDYLDGLGHFLVFMRLGIVCGGGDGNNLESVPNE